MGTLAIISANLSGILIAFYEQKLAFQTSKVEERRHLAFGRRWEGPAGRGTCVGAFFGPVYAFSPSDTNNSGRFQLQSLCARLHQRERSRSPAGITDRVSGVPEDGSHITTLERQLSVLNSKHHRESPPKMFQRNPNRPARIHKALLPPFLIIPFFLLCEAG